MKIGYCVQHPSSPYASTFRALLANKLDSGKYDQARIAVAYMTVSGLRALLSSFSSHELRNSQWLIGLDDMVTQPGALEVLLRLEGSEVRAIGYEDHGLRFHPKVYIFERLDKSSNRLAIIGSANLTASGLVGNGEAATVLETERAVDSTYFSNLWDELWQQGKQLDYNGFQRYKSRYEKNLIKRRSELEKLQRSSGRKGTILESDFAEVDPSVATRCWIECGCVTAQGRELELKAEQGLFFGLSPTGEEPKYFQFKVSSGETLELRMKFQKNHMWRLQMNNQVPEVAIGLRPLQEDGSLGRSPFAAVFERPAEQNLFDLRFVRLDSKMYKRILADSTKKGTIGKTSARRYGWS
jgi:HKD family nuclease